MANQQEGQRRTLRCGSVVVTEETDGFSVRCGDEPHLVSLGRYPDFRDAVEIPLMLERAERLRADLGRLQRCAREHDWQWRLVVEAFQEDESCGSLGRVA